MTGFVYIIESPSARDLLDGRTEGRALSEVLSLAEIPHWYSLVTTQETFDTALNKRLVEAWEHFRQPPILHLSMHGNNVGVALTNDTFLLWAELRELLIPLTNFMEGGLLICMSSCFGSFGRLMAMHEDADYPFRALVGNNSSVSWSDAAVAYVTFYHLLFKGMSIEQCVERMILASGNDKFDVWSGHDLKASWIQYMAKARKEQAAESLRRAIQA
ncbi:hypothetical protein [Coleofasciculus sp. FACHB-1120]|uniref:hypothetical protein n=1 Tax=Coleofasciculus sp. FACHB-1120 TaxID=2692783 RepID=UPI00168835CB|nr:hypothetical protein [Coleofasciculus sp. FACHB-1120]MBD2741555.1 hypothetical protein [Coleofasciculus sp. FACHB-1120]